MTSTQLRWAARTIRETATFSGLRSGGRVRRGDLGALVAQCVYRLFEDLGLSHSEIGSALRLGVPDVERSLGSVKKHRKMRRDAKKIEEVPVVEEMGFECAIF